MTALPQEHGRSSICLSLSVQAGYQSHFLYKEQECEPNQLFCYSGGHHFICLSQSGCRPRDVQGLGPWQSSLSVGLSIACTQWSMVLLIDCSLVFSNFLSQFYLTGSLVIAHISPLCPSLLQFSSKRVFGPKDFGGWSYKFTLIHPSFRLVCHSVQPCDVCWPFLQNGSKDLQNFCMIL